MPSPPQRARALIIGSLLAFSGFCVALVVARFLYVGDVRFSFLAWNLVLAWIPFLAALAVYDGAKAGKGRVRQITLAAVWLLFFPNAPYILTDLIHLGRFDDASPLWFDALLLSGFAWTGMLLGLVSLYLIHTVARRALGVVKAWLGVGAALALASYGIYLGRFERWNSWDVFARPEALLRDVVAPFVNPLSSATPIAVTVGFAGFLALAYIVVYAFAEFGASGGGGATPKRAPSRR